MFMTFRVNQFITTVILHLSLTIVAITPLLNLVLTECFMSFIILTLRHIHRESPLFQLV